MSTPQRIRSKIEPTTPDRIAALMEAPPEKLRQFDALFFGVGAPLAHSDTLRLLNISQAARAIHVSRATLHRLINAGTIPVVELRPGRRWVRESDLRHLIQPDDGANEHTEKR